MKKYISILVLNLFILINLSGQEKITLKGYISAESNQGYISNADVLIQEKSSEENIKLLVSDDFGLFSTELEQNKLYTITIHSELYLDIVKEVDTSIKNENNQVFLKVFMKRKPGYIFEISLTEIKLGPFEPVDGITDALIEVYNNTKGNSVMSFYNTRPNFDINLTKGNHYTILIRKEGYLAKQLEAYLNINGCIICFDGVSKMEPGVRSKLSADNSIGTYRANIELDKVFEGKKIKIQNIYYDLNKSFIKPKAAKELAKLAKVLRLNPGLLVELGSHTDSRGSDAYNLKLSSTRAKAAVAYLTKVLNIDKKIISYKGYGETELVNNCDDGVTCTETEHSVNRRTEIKILDILKTESGEFIPLEVQKNEEKKSNEIEEDLNSNAETKEIQDNEITNEVEKDFDNEVEVMSKTNEKVNKQSNIDKIESKDKKQIDDSNKINIPEQQNKKIEESKTGIDQKSEQSSEGFTGYKIVILFTKYPLPKGHILFKNTENLVEYNNSNDGYILYLVGEYETFDEAKVELDSKWKKSYKKAYIIRMENGIKTSL